MQVLTLRKPLEISNEEVRENEQLEKSSNFIVTTQI